MRLFLNLFSFIILPVSALFILLAISYFMLNYDLSKSIKLGTLTGFISGMVFSIIMTFILYFMRKARFIHKEKKHHKKARVHKKTNDSIVKKYILLMNKEMAFEVARTAIINQHVGDISKESNKDKGSITVYATGQTIRIRILALTKNTAEITIKADLYNDSIKNIIKYIVTKELETKRTDISKDEFKDMLLEIDVNYELAERLLEALPETINRTQAFTSLISVFQYTVAVDLKESEAKPFVEFIMGVNGTGKTTTISKLAYRYQKEGKKVILGAGDTSQTRAIKQLSRWAEKLNIPIVATKQGDDPSTVIFDTIESAKEKNMDNVIIDTSGRLYTQSNLSEELKKMTRVANKVLDTAPNRKILLLDGTQGSSSIDQAKAFNEMIDIDGIIITKLDSTTKGGSVLNIADELKMSIIYIGTGEQPKNLIRFEADEYVNTILDKIFI